MCEIKHKNIFLAILIMIMATSNVVAQKKDKKSDKKDIPLVVNEWTLGKDYSPVEYDLSQDTSLHLFQVYDKIDKSSISNSNLGNMASPYISNIFDDRPINKWNSIIFFNYFSISQVIGFFLRFPHLVY